MKISYCLNLNILVFKYQYFIIQVDKISRKTNIIVEKYTLN